MFILLTQPDFIWILDKEKLFVKQRPRGTLYSSNSYLW